MPAVFLALIASSLFYFFSYPEADNDLWGHLFFGRAVWKEGELLLENRYSYTAPDHPWINHEWLAEVIFYGAYSLLGSPALVVLKTLVAGGLIWILDRLVASQTQSPVIRLLTSIWAMALVSPGFNVRPQIFTYLFFAWLLLLLYRYEEKENRSLYWVPPLIGLWVNLHGGFVAGLGVLAVFFLWAFPKATRRKNQVDVLAPLVLSGMAAGLNPYGFRLLKFLLHDLVLDRPISEWAPIPLLGFSFLGFKLTVFCFVLFSCLGKEELRKWDFWLPVITAVFAFRHQRHTPLFAIVAAPALARGVNALFLLIRQRTDELTVKQASQCLFVGVLALAIYQLYAVSRVHLEHGFRIIVSPLEYPTQAADFLRRNKIRGNLAVPFDWGEYLIWKLHPENRVSIDGRYTTAYPMEVIQHSWAWMEARDGWKTLLERYPTEIAITHRQHPVTALFRQDPEWVYIYSDPVAFIFVRKTSSQEALLSRFREKKLVPPQPPPLYFPG